MPRFEIQSASANPTQRCCACNEAQVRDVYIAVLDTSTGDSHGYCKQHFIEGLGRDKEIIEALLEYLAERQRGQAEKHANREKAA